MNSMTSIQKEKPRKRTKSRTQPPLDCFRIDEEMTVASSQSRMSLPLGVDRRTPQSLDEELVLILDGWRQEEDMVTR